VVTRPNPLIKDTSHGQDYTKKFIHAKTHYTKLVMPLKIIDSSTLPLNLTNHKWAKFRKTKAGVKLHLRLVFMEKGTSYPEKAVMTPAKEHDVVSLKSW
jgi:hypothetical protein